MDYSKLSNRELEHLFIREGDADALAFYFRKLQPLLAYIGKGFRLEDHAIDDLMADTRVFTIEKLHILEPGHLSKWLCETMKKKCLNHLRRRRSRIRHEKTLSNQPVLVEELHYELAMDLTQAFMELPELDRNILTCQVVDGKTAEETATLLNVHVSTVERHKKKLKENLQKLCI